MKSILKSILIGFGVGTAASLFLTLGYFIMALVFPIIGDMLRNSGYFYNWFLLMFLVGVALFGGLGAIVGLIVGIKNRK